MPTSFIVYIKKLINLDVTNGQHRQAQSSLLSYFEEILDLKAEIKVISSFMG